MHLRFRRRSVCECLTWEGFIPALVWKKTDKWRIRGSAEGIRCLCSIWDIAGMVGSNRFLLSTDFFSTGCFFRDENGRQQSRDGLGTELFTLPLGWSAANLRKHPQGNDFHPHSSSAPRHILHGRNSLKFHRKEAARRPGEVASFHEPELAVSKNSHSWKW